MTDSAGEVGDAGVHEVSDPAHVVDIDGSPTLRLGRSVLATQLIFFLDHHGYRIIDSAGSAAGNAYIDLERGDLVWRIGVAKAQLTLDLRFERDRDHPAYLTDVLQRWLSGERDDQFALLTDEVAAWVAAHLSDIEQALDEHRTGTVAEWASLKRLRAQELFG